MTLLAYLLAFVAWYAVRALGVSLSTIVVMLLVARALALLGRGDRPGTHAQVFAMQCLAAGVVASCGALAGLGVLRLFARHYSWWAFLAVCLIDLIRGYVMIRPSGPNPTTIALGRRTQFAVLVGGAIGLGAVALLALVWWT